MGENKLIKFSEDRFMVCEDTTNGIDIFKQGFELYYGTALYGNCAICGKELCEGRLFVCEECSTKIKED